MLPAYVLQRLHDVVLRPQYGVPESVRMINTEDLKLLLKAYDALWEQVKKDTDSRQQY